MKVAPFPQVMEREAKLVAAGKARGDPKPLVQSHEEAQAFGPRFWAQYLNEGKPPDSEFYFKPEKMYSLMRRGSDGSPAPVRLLRLSWLLKQARRGAVLPRRQELPEEAFLSEAEVRALPRGHVGQAFETCGSLSDEPSGLRDRFGHSDKPLRIISISHGWLTPEHPDPFGEQLARFAKQIEHERQHCPGSCFEVGCSLCCNALCLGLGAGYCCYVIPLVGQQCGDTDTQLPSGEFGVFYDYCSLHQKDADGQRTQPEQAAFGTALQTMGMWYAHRLTTTVILSELPPGWPRSAEDAPFFPEEGWLRGKGWPSFERAVSGMIKRETGDSFRRIVDPTPRFRAASAAGTARLRCTRASLRPSCRARSLATAMTARWWRGCTPTRSTPRLARRGRSRLASSSGRTPTRRRSQRCCRSCGALRRST